MRGCTFCIFLVFMDCLTNMFKFKPCMLLATTYNTFLMRSIEAINQITLSQRVHSGHSCNSAVIKCVHVSTDCSIEKVYFRLAANLNHDERNLETHDGKTETETRNGGHSRTRKLYPGHVVPSRIY